jgi:hypothetical protein
MPSLPVTGSVSYRVSRARSAGSIGCATVDGARCDLTGQARVAFARDSLEGDADCRA